MSSGLSYVLRVHERAVFVNQHSAIRTRWVWVLTHLGSQAHGLINQRFGSAALVPAFAPLHVTSPKGFFAIIATALFSHPWYTQARSMPARFYNIS